jgi:hypothetical protein
MIEIAILCFTLFNSILAVLTLLMLAPLVAENTPDRKDKKPAPATLQNERPEKRQCL